MRPRNRDPNPKDRDSSISDSPSTHCGLGGANQHHGFDGATSLGQGPVEVTVQNTYRVFEGDDKSESNLKEQEMGDEEMALSTLGMRQITPGRMEV